MPRRSCSITTSSNTAASPLAPAGLAPTLTLPRPDGGGNVPSPRRSGGTYRGAGGQSLFIFTGRRIMWRPGGLSGEARAP